MRNPRPFNFFRCKYCDWCFADFSAFRKHVRSHEGKYRKFWSTRGDGLVCKCGYLVQGSIVRTHSGCPYWHSARHVTSQYFAFARQHPHAITSLYRRRRIFKTDEPVQLTPLKYDKKTHSLPEHECPHCGYGFRKLANLETHIKVHTGETNYKCKDCDRHFVSNTGLQYHRMSKHSNDKPYKCDLCGYGFIKFQHMERHKRTHLVEKPYKCKVCDKSYITNSNLKVHERTHLGVKQFHCKYCGRGFFQKGHMRDHMLSHGFPETFAKTFTCDICNRSFLRKKNLRDHYRTHTGEKPHMCNQCGQGFSTSSQCLRHIRGHSGELRYKCDQCEKGFTTANTLRRHVTKNHSGIKPYKCQLCSRGFAFMSDLRTHEECHIPDSEKPLKCHICNRGYNVQYKLNSHMRIHTGERPFECEYEGCFKKFQSSSRRSRHHNTHTGAKNHKCPLCEKAFSQTGNLKRHVRLHSGQTPYKCLFCDYRSAEKGNLKRHVKYKHPPEFTEANILKMLIPVFEDPNDKISDTTNEQSAGKEDAEETENDSISMEVCTPDDTTELTVSLDGIEKDELALINSNSPERKEDNMSQRRKTPHSSETDAKKHKCTKCEKSFSRAANLRQHIRVHSGIKPFRCIFCDFRTAEKSNLNRHVKRLHPNAFTDANLAIMAIPVIEVANDKICDTMREQSGTSVCQSEEKTDKIENRNIRMDVDTHDEMSTELPVSLGGVGVEKRESGNNGISKYLPSLNVNDPNSIVSEGAPAKAVLSENASTGNDQEQCAEIAGIDISSSHQVLPMSLISLDESQGLPSVNTLSPEIILNETQNGAESLGSTAAIEDVDQLTAAVDDAEQVSADVDDADRSTAAVDDADQLSTADDNADQFSAAVDDSDQRSTAVIDADQCSSAVDNADQLSAAVDDSGQKSSAVDDADQLSLAHDGEETDLCMPIVIRDLKKNIRSGLPTLSGPHLHVDNHLYKDAEQKLPHLSVHLPQDIAAAAADFRSSRTNNEPIMSESTSMPKNAPKSDTQFQLGLPKLSVHLPQNVGSGRIYESAIPDDACIEDDLHFVLKENESKNSDSARSASSVDSSVSLRDASVDLDKSPPSLGVLLQDANCNISRKIAFPVKFSSIRNVKDIPTACTMSKKSVRYVSLIGAPHVETTDISSDSSRKQDVNTDGAVHDDNLQDKINAIISRNAEVLESVGITEVQSLQM